MRRIYVSLAILILVCAGVQAQKCGFQFEGQNVQDGDTVMIAAVEDELSPGKLVCETNPSSDPNNGLILKLLSGSSASGRATMKIEQNALNPKRIQWCMGGECNLMTRVTELEKDFSFEGGIVQVQFEAYDIRNEGSMVASLTVQVGSESHIVRIMFTNGSSSDVKSIYGASDNNYYNLSGQQINSPSNGINIVNGKKIYIR